MMLWKYLKKRVKQMRCKHEHVHVRNIHGDQIIHMGWNRSIWKCPKCDHVEYRKHLHPIPVHSDNDNKVPTHKTREDVPPIEIIKTVNEDHTQYDGYELTLAEAIVMAYQVQDVHHDLLVEHSRLLNGGNSMLGPSGRRSFSNMRTVLAYMQDTEQGINRLRNDIDLLKREGKDSLTQAIKEAHKRITVKD